MRAISLAVGAVLALLAWPGATGAAVLQPVGTFAAPIYVTAPPGDPRLFVVERAGTIRVYKNGATLGTAFLDISALTTTDGERGLLSMAFDPNFATNGLLYIDYTGDGTDSGGALGDIHVDEFKVSANPDIANSGSRRQVLTIPHSTASNHNGGQLQFGKDGQLYISVGDGGASSATAQDPNSPLGKLLRINPHQSGADPYTIPSTNPFFGSLSTRNEIWSSGLRNPWRFSFDHIDGSLLIGDVGAGAREEVDYRPPSVGAGKGDNFGWNCREGFIAGPGGCSGSFIDPIFDYPHVGCAYYAITGGFVYRGSDIPALVGRYLYADLCFQQLRSLVPGLPFASGDRAEGVGIGAQPFSFGEDSRCEVYVAAGSTVSKIVASAGAVPGSGGCGGASAAPEPAVGVQLRAAKRRVRLRRRARLVVTAEPCPASAGSAVELLRGKSGTSHKTLDAQCQATFRPRIFRRTRFVAVLPQNAVHGAATSSSIKIKLKH